MRLVNVVGELELTAALPPPTPDRPSGTERRQVYRPYWVDADPRLF
jgi:hypothetical protein